MISKINSSKINYSILLKYIFNFLNYFSNLKFFNLKNFFRFKISIILFLSFFILPSCADFNASSDCTTIEYVNASVEIRQMERNVIGLNADSDHLNFGAVSPGTEVRRKISVEYSKSADVFVEVDGESDLKRWISITPHKFTLDENQSKEILFVLDVPADYNEGFYDGKVRFCFIE